MGLGTVIAAPPIRRGTSRPFQRALENLSTTSGGFKTFTLKISMVMVYGLLDQNRGVFTFADPKPYLIRPPAGLRASKYVNICLDYLLESFRPFNYM